MSRTPASLSPVEGDNLSPRQEPGNSIFLWSFASPDHTCFVSRHFLDAKCEVIRVSSEPRVAPSKSKPSSPELKLNYRDYLKPDRSRWPVPGWRES